ncbi:MAG: hypothetical protein WAQ57_04245 [Candidatus Saccharimonadales bacterium]
MGSNHTKALFKCEKTASGAEIGCSGAKPYVKYGAKPDGQFMPRTVFAAERVL